MSGSETVTVTAGDAVFHSAITFSNGNTTAATHTDQLNTLSNRYLENLVYERGINCTLSGGWNSNFSAVSGYTKISGKLTIKSGSMIVGNLIIK